MRSSDTTAGAAIRPLGLTVLELERALFWGGLWFHAFKTAVLTAVVAAAGMAACSRST
jgi:hypothetical protein